MLYAAADDRELSEWIKYQSEGGSDFLRSLADLAMKADFGNYQVLRPSLVSLRSQNPEPGSTVATVTTDGYRITFNDVDTVDALVCAFNRFNGVVFDNSLPETKIRWASSIQSLRQPGTPVGLLALPDDPVTHLLPGQLRLNVPHIFVSEKLRGVSPIDEWVLLHEMCHFKVRHHGLEFIEELKHALDSIGWSVLLGGF